MTWLQGAVEESELANRTSALQFTNETPEPGVWQGSLDAIGPGLERGFIEGSSAIESGFSSLWQSGLEAAAGALLPEPKHGGTPNVTSMEDAAQETLGEGTAQVVQQLRPDPRTTGIAGQLLGEAAAILPRAAIGTLAAGPIGGAVAAGAPAGYSSKQVGMAEGLDESTATIKGAIEGVTVGVGAVLPAAKFVKPVVGDLAIAVGANVGLGVASRGATAELLEQNGYTAQAAQYRAMDGTAMLVDGVLGAAFFGLARGLSARPSTRQVNAALTESNAQHAEIGTAPGVPIDPLAAAAHVRALDTASAQLVRGEPVRLPDDMPEASFLRADREPDAVGVELARLQDEQSVADSRANGDDFAVRVGRESVYDDSGAPTFTDGTAYPLREVARFFDQYIAVAQPKDGAVMPDVLFQIGEVGDQVAQGLHQFLPGFHDGLREARITARALKHIQDSRPEIVRDVLARLEAGVLRADEVLPNPQEPKRALVVLRNVSDAPTKVRHQNTVLEVAANGKGVDVVSAMTSPDRYLKKARDLAAEMGASRSEGLRSPHPHLEAGKADNLTRQQTNFPTVDRGADSSIRPGKVDATDPEVQLAQMVIDQVGDIQVPTGAIDADGNPLMVSARTLLDEADADIQRAQQDSLGIAAAAACSLQRGE